MEYSEPRIEWPGSEAWANGLSEDAGRRRMYENLEVGELECVQDVVLSWASFRAGLLIVSPVAPLVAAVISVLAVSSGVPYVGLLAFSPLVNAALAWAVSALVAMGMGLTTSRGALRGTYDELVQNLKDICVWHRVLQTTPRPSLLSAWALDVMVAQVNALNAELRRPGAQWFLGTGYLGVWRRMHWAQEALARVVPADTLPSLGRVELQRLGGSDIDGHDQDFAEVQSAMTLLGVPDLPQQARRLIFILNTVGIAGDSKQVLVVKDAVDQLRSAIMFGAGLWEQASLEPFNNLNFQAVLAPTSVDQVNDFKSALLAALAGLKPLSAATAGPTSDEQARDVIVSVRQKVDGFRDAKRSGLLRVRSELIATITVASALVYVLLWTTMAALWTSLPGGDPLQPFQQIVLGAAILFEVGAVAGLFQTLANRESSPANTDALGEDDFGMSIVRLLGAPVLAGVGGLGGVLLVAFGKAAFMEGINNVAPTFWAVFYPGSSPASLIVAAAFALSPKYLLDGLTQKASQFQQALQGSNVSGTSAGTEAARAVGAGQS